MTDIHADLLEIISKKPAAPFLFIGSGMSRRYLGLEDWDGLLSRFCITGRPYEYFKSSANQVVPKAANLICDAYHEYWWNNDDFLEERKLSSGLIRNKTTPLRLAISSYIKQKIQINSEFQEEIELLKKCDVDGIITTNWDCFLETLFPDYKVYVGQNELLFSNPLNVCEIYKIHGCCTDPESLILTDEDYANFNTRNAYLASKLITIFVEHPIIFMGYSLSDPNIQDLLTSIANCIGEENLEKLHDNLIFIDRNEGARGPSIENSFIKFSTTQLPIKIVKTKSFSPIYSAIGSIERRMPARVLRFCKERIFEVVKDENPERKIAVIDFDKIDNPELVEVVFGLGVIAKFGDQGYSAITIDDLFHDLIFDDKKYDAMKIIQKTFPGFHAKLKFTPIYQYMRKLEINDVAQAKKKIGPKNFDKIKRYLLRPEDFCSSGSVGINQTKILMRQPMHEIANSLPKIKNPDLPVIHNFLKENYNENIKSPKTKYQFRRIAAYYDYMRFGFEV